MMFLPSQRINVQPPIIPCALQKMKGSGKALGGRPLWTPFTFNICLRSLPRKAVKLYLAGDTGQEREICFKAPTFLGGNTPATIGYLEGASLVCLSFLASAQSLCLASPRGESPGPHMKDQESNPKAGCVAIDVGPLCLGLTRKEPLKF